MKKKVRSACKQTLSKSFRVKIVLNIRVILEVQYFIDILENVPTDVSREAKGQRIPRKSKNKHK